jgi:aldose sugar dehydrogenase
MTTSTLPKKRSLLFRGVRAVLVSAAILIVGLGGYIAIFGIQSLINSGPAQAAASAAAVGLKVETVTDKISHPWSVAFLPDGRKLVTSRDGALYMIGSNGKKSAPLKNVPAVDANGQGGLFDVILAPDFDRTRTIYLSYAEADAKNKDINGTAIARATLGENGLSQVTVIFRQLPKFDSSAHFGGRMVIAPDARGTPVLFATLGDRFDLKEKAQDLSTLYGKIIRINLDGSVPVDNPFVTTKGARPEIWSYGHRNPQGLIYDAATKRLWETEHGPRGGDELNLIEPGKNYGWPVITWGIDYSGAKIGIGTTKAGMEQPVTKWVPSIATSGLTMVTSDKYPGWQGALLVGALAHERIVKLDMNGATVAKQTPFLGDLGERIRDVRQGPDGFIYVLTDADDGKLLRLMPKG